MQDLEERMANEAQAPEKEKEKEAKKAKRSSALKRQIQSEKRRLENKAFRSRARGAVKQFRETLAIEDAAKKMADFSEVSSSRR